VHPASKFLLELLQFRSHPFACRLAPDDEAALLRPTVMRESQEVEGLRFALTTFPAVYFSVSSELDQSCFIWMEFQPEFRQPFPKGIQETFSVLTVLETSTR
jgi:hypothetical protein